MNLRHTAQRCLLVVVALLVLGAAPAHADWTTYHADAARTGVDHTSATTALPFASTWTSQNLGGDIYAEPLIYHGLVIVATEQNDVYALSEATGQVVWHTNPGAAAGLGTASDPGAAVPYTSLPCGDIGPWVGITSTPVIDPATGTLFVVADLWNGSVPAHTLVAYHALNGHELWSKDVDQRGSYPADQLQRAGLNLDDGRVLIGFGGNAGDCASPGTSYWGWLVSVAENGSSMSAWQAPTGKGDAIWAPGGPTVDSSGDIYAVTGNGSSEQTGDPFDYSDSVIKFTSASNFPAHPSAADYFTPANWIALNVDDLDLSSSGTVLLPDNLAFQDGKDGNGYLLSTTDLGGIGGQLYEQQINCVSKGGDAYEDGIIYVTCAAIQALRVNASSPSRPSFSQLWQGPSDANGPPIIAGGRVWVTSTGDSVLYGLNPETGAVEVQQSTPAMEHFTSPAASDGQLVLATGPTVEAYRIAASVGSPTISAASLSGIAKGNPRFGLTVRAGRNAPALVDIVIAPPTGLRFEGKGLARGLTVAGANGKRARFTAELRHGVLTIALRRSESTVKVVLHGQVIAVTKELEHKPRATLLIVVKALDAGGTTTPLTLKLRP